ncbi:hypothetical protein [Mariprofundus ferrooxydans]|uniref:Uncharacterized protein n=1 Tax=Mariprofundus ferrooxydans PV-1 TaxID=314345 RepID=Q0EZT3_9PROT|nr:hypothetical protein [Mariprofundus ferrooxydans]EAU54951.1 hypothetical protein SPV1_09658 [Mariprofundus ferrooxydans PV-1]KON46507.1 hypothetical protein AL013_12850 [Mariprofundus ferrooxydans]
MKSLKTLILLLILFLPYANAHAAWWEFGRESSEPYFTSLQFNSLDSARLDEGMVLSPEDLQNGSIVVRGQAQVGRGNIGLVEISIDEGKTWEAAKLDDRGMFTWEFRPEIGHDYLFQIRAVSTTGVSTGAEENDFHLLVLSVNGTTEAKETFRKMLNAYMHKDRSGFMDLVSNSFEGNISALEDALTDDFRWLDSIAIQANITRVVSNHGVYELYFTYNRQVRSMRSGQFLKDSAASVVGFRRSVKGMKLVRMSAPLLFGVSDTANIATYVTGQAVGQNVLTLDPTTGNASLGSQGETASATSTSGTQFLALNQSYNFDTDSVANEGPGPAVQGDVKPEVGVVFTRNGVGSQRIPCPISSTSSAPAGGYIGQPYLLNAQAGSCFALEMLPGPRYALVEVVSYNAATGDMTFRYKYQPSGGRNF